MQTINDLAAFLRDKRITIVAPLGWREIIRGRRDPGGNYTGCRRALYPAGGACLAWLASELGTIVRLITAPPHDAPSQRAAQLLTLQGVEVICDETLPPSNDWRLVVCDDETGEEATGCRGQQDYAWRLPADAALQGSAAILIQADQNGSEAPLVKSAFRHTVHVAMSGLPETPSPGDTVVLGLQNDKIEILQTADIKTINPSTWPDAAPHGVAEINALAALLHGLTKSALSLDTLAQHLSRLQPPDLQEAAARDATVTKSAAKLLPLALLKKAIAQEKAAGRRIVWTNGCFDIVHAGHVTYLERAAALGDVLVVGLNSDASVKLSKGENRPIVPEDQRAKLLAALRCVDYLVIYDDQSPLELIRQLKPDIYAKGGDYNIDTINQPERRLMENLGGRIELLPGVPGISTSVIIENVLKAYAGRSGD